jgi:hypothetical protein
MIPGPFTTSALCSFYKPTVVPGAQTGTICDTCTAVSLPFSRSRPDLLVYPSIFLVYNTP